MSGLKIGWDASSLNSLKMQLAEQIDKITQQKIELGVNIKDDIVIKQLNSMFDAIKSVQDTAAKPVDIQVNASKSKQELADIKGSFEDIINTYKQLGQISVSPTFDRNGMIKSFTVQLQQLNGLIDKVKYNANEFVDGKNSMTPISFKVDNIKEINNLDQTMSKVEDFKNKYNNAVKELQGIKVDSVAEFQKQLNSLNINNFKEKTDQIKNTYNELLNEQNKYSEGIKQQEQLNNFVNTQQNKLNNVRSGYSGKLDAGSSQYTGLENTYRSLINELNTYKQAGQSLTTEQSNDIKNRINDFNREKSSIVSITNTIKQQETALDTLKSRFGNIIPDSKINELKASLQGLYTSPNLKGDTNGISQEIEKLRQLATEVQRVKGFGSNLGTFSGTGLDINSGFQDVEKFLQSTVSAKASISSINESVDSLGNKIKTVNYTINEGSNVISKHKMTIDGDTQGIYNLNTGLQNVDEKNRSFSSGIASSVKGLLSFSAASAAVYGGINQIKDAIQNVIDLNKSQTNIQMITGANQSQVKGLTQQFSDLATQLHSTTGEMMSGAEGFLRAGDSIEQTKSMLKATTIGATLSGQSNQDVADQLIAISNGFRMNTKDASAMMDVISKLTKADNTSATSFKEISTAMQGSSAMAQSVKVDFDHLLAYISTVSSVTRENASSIGSSFQAQFARYQNVKGGQKFDPEGQDLSNVERDLNKYADVKLRSDAGTFKSYETVLDELAKKFSNLPEVSRAAISKAMAGVNHANDFQVLMQNYDKVKGMLKDVGDSAGYAEEKFNNVWNKSTLAKIKDFQHAVENLYQAMVTSGSINKALQGLTSFIHTLDTLITTTPKSGIALVGLATALILVIKNGSGVTNMFTGLGAIFGNFITMSKQFGVITGLAGTFDILATSIKGVTIALLTNPLTYIIAGIGIASAVIINHVQKQQEMKEKTDQLKTSYEGLTQAMKDNSSQEIKTNLKPFQDKENQIKSLQKQKQELENQMSDPGTTGLVKDYDSSKLKKINSDIADLKKQMDDAGVSTNTLAQAQNQLYNNNLLQNVQDEAKAKTDKNNKTKDEISEYQQLAEVQDKDATQRERMSQLSQDLSKSIDGLVVSKDKDGNITITNTGLLDSEGQMLDVQNGKLQTSANVAMEAAKSKMRWQINDTTVTYAEVNARIAAYEAESQKLQEIAEKGGNETKNGGYTANEAGNRKAGRDVASVTPGTQIYADLQAQKKMDDAWDKSQKAIQGVTGATTDLADENNNGFAPSEENATDATKANTEMQKQAEQAVKASTLAMKDYDNQIKDVENTVKNYDYELSTLNDHSEKYIATLEKKKEVLKQELALTQQAAAAGQGYANSLNSQSSNVAGINYTTNGTGGSGSGTQWTGKYADWINTAANNNGLDPLLVAAIIQDESSFNPLAYNRSSGATGLGQFLASTGAEMGIYKKGQYDYRTDPQSSIFALAAYLKKRINQAGSVKGGIKGYGEGTESYYNKIMGFYNQFKGGSTGDGVVSGQDAANTLASGADSLQSQVESYVSNIDTLKQAIDQITEDQIKAKEGIFDDQITEAKNRADIAKTNADLYNEGSQQKVSYLEQESKAINEQYGAMAKKEEFIQNSIKNGGYNQKIIAELKKDLQDVQNTEVQTVQNLHQVFSDFIDARTQARIDIYENKLDTLKQKFDLIDTKDKDNYKDKLDLEKQELVQQEKIKVGLEDQIQYVEQLISKEKYATTREVLNSKLDDLNKQLLDVDKTLATIQNTIDELDLDNKLKQYADDTTNLKNQLSQLNSATNKGYSEKIDIINKIIADDEKQNGIISQRIKLLQDEASRFADNSSEKIALLDQVNDLEQKQNSIQQDRIDQYKQLEQQAENKVLDLIEKQIYGGQTQQEFEDAVKARENAIDAQLKAMDKQNQALQEQETRDKNLLDLEQARVKLQQDQNDRSVQQLTKDKSGNWNWTYVANQSTVDQDEQDLRDKQQSNNDWEHQTAQQHLQDQLNDEKTALEQEVQIRQETMDRIKTNIENAFNDEKDLFSTGQTDINKIVKSSLSEMENLYGVSFGNIVDTVSSSVESILGEIGKINPDFVNAQNGILGVLPSLNENPTVPANSNHVIYGSDVDLQNAKAMLGTNGYTYKDISTMTDEERKNLKLGDNDMLLGGAAVTYGITEKQNGGTGTRLWGQDRNGTNARIAEYAEQQGANHFIYSAGEDLVNARKIYGDSYQYIPTDGWTQNEWSQIHTKAGDRVIGTQESTPGLSLGDATRWGGADRGDTANQMESDALSMGVNNRRNVYASGQDYINAVKILDSSYYNVIDMGASGFDASKVQLTGTDRILGGAGVTPQAINNQIAETGAKRIYGQTAADTAKELQKYRDEDLANVEKYNQNVTKNVKSSTQQQTVIFEDAKTKETKSIQVGAQTNLGIITQNMSDLNDVAYNGMGQLVLTVNDNVNQAIDSFQKLEDAMAAVGMSPDSTTPTQLSNTNTGAWTIASGSDAAILKAQFGDKLTIYPGTGMSGRPGTTRYDTNKLYLEDIAQKWGLTPTNSNVDMSKFDTGGENTKTGLQWLDGTPDKPEYVLNSEDTAKMYKAVDLIKDIDMDGIANRFNNIASSNLLDNIIIPRTPEVASNINNKSQPTQVTHQYYFNKLELPHVTDGVSLIRELGSFGVKQYTSSYKNGY